MKKMIFILGLAASACVLASCATKGTIEQPNAASTVEPVHVHHHDYKGETK